MKRPLHICLRFLAQNYVTESQIMMLYICRNVSDGFGYALTFLLLAKMSPRKYAPM